MQSSSALRPPVGPLARPEHAPLQRKGRRLLDRHRALLPADELHRLRAAAPAASGGGVHPPRLPRLLPGGAVVSQAPRRGAAACAGAGAAQGVGLCRLRHRARLCAHRPLLGGRWPGGVGLGGGHQRALGVLVFLLAPPAGHVYRLFAGGPFSCTAACTSAVNAPASTVSPSWMSIALRMLPSKLELKRRAGSGIQAPRANVSFTTFLYASPVQTIPWCDQTGFIHFHSSVISEA